MSWLSPSRDEGSDSADSIGQANQDQETLHLCGCPVAERRCHKCLSCFRLIGKLRNTPLLPLWTLVAFVAAGALTHSALRNQERNLLSALRFQVALSEDQYSDELVLWSSRDFEVFSWNRWFSAFSFVSIAAALLLGLTWTFRAASASNAWDYVLWLPVAFGVAGVLDTTFRVVEVSLFQHDREVSDLFILVSLLAFVKLVSGVVSVLVLIGFLPFALWSAWLEIRREFSMGCCTNWQMPDDWDVRQPGKSRRKYQKSKWAPTLSGVTERTNEEDFGSQVMCHSNSETSSNSSSNDLGFVSSVERTLMLEKLSQERKRSASRPASANALSASLGTVLSATFAATTVTQTVPSPPLLVVQPAPAVYVASPFGAGPCPRNRTLPSPTSSSSHASV